MSQNKPRELLESLFEPETFAEIGEGAESGIIAGFGDISGNRVCAYVQNMGVKSGALNKNAAAKMKKIYSNAVKFGLPVVAVFDSKGGEIGEGTALIDAYSETIENAARLSGVVPLISIVAGQCSGLNAVLARMSDIVIATGEAELFFTPPFLVGNPKSPRPSIADITVKDANEAVSTARRLLSILPPNNIEPPFCVDFEQADSDITALNAIADKGSVIEIGAGSDCASTTAFAVLNGGTTGFVVLDRPDLKITAADTAKIARFVSFCDAFSLPVVIIIAGDGFEPDMDVCGATRLAQVCVSAATPKIYLITGRVSGAALVLTGGWGSDFVLAYDDAVISPIALKAAAAFLEMPEADYVQKHANPQNALKNGYVDMIITPADARDALIRAVETARNKRVGTPKRKHINFVF